MNTFGTWWWGTSHLIGLCRYNRKKVETMIQKEIPWNITSIGINWPCLCQLLHHFIGQWCCTSLAFITFLWAGGLLQDVFSHIWSSFTVAVQTQMSWMSPWDFGVDPSADKLIMPRDTVGFQSLCLSGCMDRQLIEDKWQPQRLCSEKSTFSSLKCSQWVCLPASHTHTHTPKAKVIILVHCNML